MNLKDKVVMILTRPVDFFKRAEKDVGQAFGYLALFYLIFVILTLVVSFYTEAVSVVVLKQFNIPVPEQPEMSFRIISTVFAYVMALLFSFIISAILHVYLVIFAGKASYSQTYSMMVHAGTPTMLFGWLPIVSFFAGVWSLVLLILGISEVHKMSRMRATLLILVPLVVFVLVGVLIAMIAAFLVLQALN